MVEQWTPTTKRQLVKGIPAERYYQFVKHAAPPALISLAGWIITMFSIGDGWNSNPVCWIFIGIFILFGPQAYGASFSMAARSTQENRAGYSTFQSTGRDDLHLDEVDWKSRYVIRSAGEPQLTKSERAERIRLARLAGGS